MNGMKSEPFNHDYQYSKKYCGEECAKIAKRNADQRKYQPRLKKRAPFGRLCKRRDCLYYAPKWEQNGCDYMYLTDEKRGCPSGDGCTRYKKSTPGEQSQYREKVMSKWENTFTHKIE